MPVPQESKEKKGRKCCTLNFRAIHIGSLGSLNRLRSTTAFIPHSDLEVDALSYFTYVGTIFDRDVLCDFVNFSEYCEFIKFVDSNNRVRVQAI